jgi:DNA-binding MarR family transcriptional regulator
MSEFALDVEGSLSATKSVRGRIGVLADHGWWPLPNLLMLHQAELELTSSELNVLMNLMMHYHQRGRLPFPRTQTIADRMGVGVGTVQRLLRALKKRGLVELRRSRHGRVPNVYDIRPTLKMLEVFAYKKTALLGERSFDELPEHVLLEQQPY